jgi:hypothetical protein
VTGFAFTVEGSVIPEAMRFRSAPGGGDAGVDFHYCRTFSALSGDTVEMPFDTLDFQCWSGLHEPFIADEVLVIGWNIPSDPFSSHPFDFCIRDVRPILR